MRLVRNLQVSMATIMMMVVTSAAASALFAKLYTNLEMAPAPSGWKVDAPSLFILAIVLSGIALGSWKDHSAVQTMLQITLFCAGCLFLIWILEAHFERATRYWFQTTFACTVTVPILARRFVKAEMPRGPRRDWWKKTCEAVFFSFLNMMLVTVGGLLQAAVYAFGTELFQSSTKR